MYCWPRPDISLYFKQFGATCGSNQGHFPPAASKPGYKAHHSHPSSSKINSGWSYTSTSPSSCHGVSMDVCLPLCHCYCMLSVWMSVYCHVAANACCHYGCLSTVMLLLLHAVSMDVCLPSCCCYCMLSLWMSVYRHVAATACCQYGCLSTVMLLLLHAVSMDVCLLSCCCYCMLSVWMSVYRHVTATACCPTAVSDHKPKHSLSLTNNKLSSPNNMQNCKCSTCQVRMLLHSHICLVNDSVTYRCDGRTDRQTFINMFNNTLIFFTNSVQALLCPSSQCLITRTQSIYK